MTQDEKDREAAEKKITDLDYDRDSFIAGIKHARDIDRLNEIKDALMDMIGQHCADHQYGGSGGTKFMGYDSQCLSANESALSLAVELGWIKKEDVIR